jgi:hypothetical protein
MWIKKVKIVLRRAGNHGEREREREREREINMAS